MINFSIARSIVSSFPEAKAHELSDYAYVKGEGVKGTIDNSIFSFGNDRMLKRLGVIENNFCPQL